MRCTSVSLGASSGFAVEPDKFAADIIFTATSCCQAEVELARPSIGSLALFDSSSLSGCISIIASRSKSAQLLQLAA
jgi:hypothetical protein